MSEVDVIPAPISQPLPIYPFELRKANVTGSAKIFLTVKKDGTVGEAVIIKATDIRLGEEARSAVLQWRFHPARVQNQPVDCSLMVPIDFNL